MRTLIILPLLCVVAYAQSTEDISEGTDGLGCDLKLFNEFITSKNGSMANIYARLCEAKIQYLKTSLAGGYGPIKQESLYTVMCSSECLQSDLLHVIALSKSRCTCAQVSSDTFLTHEFCLENSARLLCTHLGECGQWNCKLEDFMCLRYEWDRLYQCEGIQSSCFISMFLLIIILLLYALL